MMEIKGVYTAYRISAQTNGGKPIRCTESTQPIEQNHMDRVQISNDGSFKAVLAEASKAFATDTFQDCCTTRIEQLKQAYAGESCPISDEEIAGAILNRVLGVGFKPETAEE